MGIALRFTVELLRASAAHSGAQLTADPGGRRNGSGMRAGRSRCRLVRPLANSGDPGRVRGGRLPGGW